MGRTCELCPGDSETPASIYCAADVCYLCKKCDQEVHSANRLARRHVRRPVSQDEIEDGSSINDDSDARVPDVSTTAPSSKTGATLGTDASTNDALHLDKKHDGPVSSATAADLPSLNDVSVTFEDAAEYDFCFEALGARMPLLAAGDDDTIFTDGKVHKTMYAEMSWDSVVSDAFEHVVPDVENQARKDTDAKNGASWDATRGRVTSHSAPHVRHVKGEDVNAPLDLDLDFEYEITDLVDTPTRQDSDTVASDLSSLKTEVVIDGADESVVKDEVDMKSEVQVKDEDVKMEDVLEAETPKVKVAPSQEKGDAVAKNNDKKGKPSPKNAKAVADEDEAKLQEQRKKRRMEALARFRSKRANRSFTKKVRYECRKQLADSRPRVKGRFVRKVEMALFRKYGALYRDHLDELDTKADAPCVPTS